MPYIPDKDREEVIKRGAINVGELNFLITLAMIKAYRSLGRSYTSAHKIWKYTIVTGDNFFLHDDVAIVALRGRLHEIKIAASTRGLGSEFATAIDLAKMEFYRRVIAPYEDKKKKENGDVYGDLDE